MSIRIISHQDKGKPKTCDILNQKTGTGGHTMNLGEKIKLLRSEKGLSQTILEKKSGVNAKLLSKYENGRILPTADTLKKIAQALETSTDYLIFDNVPKDGLTQLADLDLFEKFKEVERLDPEDKAMIKKLIDAVVIKTKVQQVLKPASQEPWEGRMKKTLTRLRDRAKGYSEDQIMQIVDEAVQAVRLEEQKKAAI